MDVAQGCTVSGGGDVNNDIVLETASQMFLKLPPKAVNVVYVVAGAHPFPQHVYKQKQKRQHFWHSLRY